MHYLLISDYLTLNTTIHSMIPLYLHSLYYCCLIHYIYICYKFQYIVRIFVINTSYPLEKIYLIFSTLVIINLCMIFSVQCFLESIELHKSISLCFHQFQKFWLLFFQICMLECLVIFHTLFVFFYIFSLCF